MHTCIHDSTLVGPLPAQSLRSTWFEALWMRVVAVCRRSKQTVRLLDVGAIRVYDKHLTNL